MPIEYRYYTDKKLLKAMALETLVIDISVAKDYFKEGGLDMAKQLEYAANNALTAVQFAEVPLPDLFF